MMSRRSRVKDTYQPQETEGPCYRPTSYSWQTQQCRKLSLPFVRLMELKSPSVPLCLRVRAPSRIRETDGDGNCLFRCFSLVITGSDAHHVLVRKIIVDHIARNGKIFSAFFPESLQDNPNKYISKTRMAYEGTWGSDVEIMAAAHLLKTRIFVYTIHGDNWQWVEHNVDITAPKSKMHNEAIYLMHTGLVHYDLVEDVEPQQHISRRDEASSKSEYRLRSHDRYVAKPKNIDSRENKSKDGRHLKLKPPQSTLKDTCSNNCYGNMALALATDEFAYAKWLLRRRKTQATREKRRRFLSSEN